MSIVFSFSPFVLYIYDIEQQHKTKKKICFDMNIKCKIRYFNCVGVTKKKIINDAIQAYGGGNEW